MNSFNPFKNKEKPQESDQEGKKKSPEAEPEEREMTEKEIENKAIHLEKNIEGVGANTSSKLVEKLGAENIKDVIEAASNKKLQEIEGIGEKRENEILERAKQAKERRENKIENLKEKLTKFKTKQEAIAEMEKVINEGESKFSKALEYIGAKEKKNELKKLEDELHKKLGTAEFEEEGISERKLEWKKDIYHEMIEKVEESENLEDLYQNELEEYERMKAEYIGEKTQRALNEKKSLAEAMNKQEIGSSTFEKIKENWKKLSDYNLYNALPEDWQPEGSINKTILKFMSLRTASTTALLGISAATGSYAVGGAAYGLRRAMSGAGFGFGTYDMVKNFKDAKELSVSKEEVKNMDNDELEEKMNQLTMKASIEGKRPAQEESYRILRKEYKNRAEESGQVTLSSETQKEINKAMQEKAEEINKIDKTALSAGITAGTLTATLLPTAVQKSLDQVPDMGATEFLSGFLEENEKAYEEVAQKIEEATGQKPENPERAAQKMQDIQNKTTTISKDTLEKAQQKPGVSEETLETAKEGLVEKEEKKTPLVIKDKNNFDYKAYETKAERVIEYIKENAPEDTQIKIPESFADKGLVNKGESMFEFISETTEQEPSTQTSK
ncbi:MAG: helix-hairpin-helix domain-containing protein, partial [Candidatus Magasanikbacteria bacterium]